MTPAKIRKLARRSRTLRERVTRMALLGGATLGLLILLVAVGLAGTAVYANQSGVLRGEEVQCTSLLVEMLRQDSGLSRHLASPADTEDLEAYEDGRKDTGEILARLRSDMAGTTRAAELAQVEAAAETWQQWAENVIHQGKADPDDVEQGQRLLQGFTTLQGKLASDLEADYQAAIVMRQRAIALAAISLMAGSVVLAAVLVQLARRVRRLGLDPLRHLAEAATRVASGARVSIPHVDRTDEIGTLAGALRAWETAAAERAILADQAPIGICRLDPEWRVVSVNQAMQAMLARPPERMLKYRFSELVHPQDRAELEAEGSQTWAAGTDRRALEVRGLRGDGSVLWCSLLGSALRGPDGNPEGFVVIAEDISERRKQMERAARIQRALLPEAAVNLEGYELAGACVPAQEVAGDFFDWALTERGELDLTVADVMGKGIGAALVMATLRAALRAAPPELGPVQRLTLAGRSMTLGADDEGLFVTVFHARLNPMTGELRYVDAGHGHCAVRRASGELEPLPIRGTPLGVRSDEKYAEGKLRLQPGDMLVVYSDGLVEHEESVVKLGTFEPAFEKAVDAADTVQRLLGGVPSPPEDDVTVVVLRRLAEASVGVLA
jgi:PAS domain S-box-containing protein